MVRSHRDGGVNRRDTLKGAGALLMAYPNNHQPPEYLRERIERAVEITDRSFGVLKLSPTTDKVAYYYQNLLEVPAIDGRPLWGECNQHFIKKSDMHRTDDAWIRKAALIEEDNRRRVAHGYCRKFGLDEAA